MRSEDIFQFIFGYTKVVADNFKTKNPNIFCINIGLYLSSKTTPNSKCRVHEPWTLERSEKLGQRNCSYHNNESITSQLNGHGVQGVSIWYSKGLWEICLMKIAGPLNILRELINKLLCN